MGDTKKIRRIIEQAHTLIEEKADYKTPGFESWCTIVKSFLCSKFGENSPEYTSFVKRKFVPSVIPINANIDLSEHCKKGIESTIKEFEYYLEDEREEDDEVLQKQDEDDVNGEFELNKVFIVHGHNGELKESIARVIEAQGIKPIILSEQVNKGKTIIEKIEDNTDVNAAIILLTDDDVGRDSNDEDCKPRPRQNVVFEAGYFMATLGRKNIIIVADDNIEIPSDLQGIVYTSKSDWKIEVCKELKEIGFKIDFNKLY